MLIKAKKTIALIISALTMVLWPSSVLVHGSESGEPTAVSNTPNIEINAVYSDGIEPLPGDSYCITYEVNGDKGHISLDASLGASGYMNEGIYNVIGISYVGANENEMLKDTPTASDSVIRIRANETTNISLAIGEQASKKLRREKGERNIYTQGNGLCQYDNSSTMSGMRLADENPQPAIRSLEAFGDDEEARNEYLDRLKEEGLVDEMGQLTEKASELLRRYDEAMQPVGSDVLLPDEEAPEPMIEPEDVPDDVNDTGDMNDTNDTNDTVQDGYSSDYENSGSEEYKVKYFDTEENVEEEVKEEKTSHPILAMIIKYLPNAIFPILILIAFIWYKKH